MEKYKNMSKLPPPPPPPLGGKTVERGKQRKKTEIWKKYGIYKINTMSRIKIFKIDKKNTGMKAPI